MPKHPAEAIWHAVNTPRERNVTGDGQECKARRVCLEKTLLVSCTRCQRPVELNPSRGEGVFAATHSNSKALPMGVQFVDIIYSSRTVHTTAHTSMITPAAHPYSMQFPQLLTPWAPGFRAGTVVISRHPCVVSLCLLLIGQALSQH